jgi:hypothetical protein
VEHGPPTLGGRLGGGVRHVAREFKGKIELDVRDSVADREAFLTVADDAYVDVTAHVAAAMALNRR